MNLEQLKNWHKDQRKKAEEMAIKHFNIAETFKRSPAKRSEAINRALAFESLVQLHTKAGFILDSVKDKGTFALTWIRIKNFWRQLNG